MITKSLKQFASPIITTAMETGGRSSTTTNTDYGVVGDALAKKSQMEFQMATIKGEMDMRMADMKATNSLKVIDINEARDRKHLERVENSRPLPMMEKVMGTLQGVASGAQAGMAIGGPKGAIAGGILGGAASGSSYFGPGGNQQKTREAGARTNQTIGGIATIATATRSIYNDYKGKEVYKSGMDNLGKLQQGIGSMGPGPEKDAAVAQYNTKMQSMQGELGKYMGPQEAGAAMQGVRAGQSAFMSNDPETRRQGEMAQIGVQMAADPDLAPSSGKRVEKLQQYHGQLNALNAQKYGYDKQHQISPQEFSQYAGGIRPDLGMAVKEYSIGAMGTRGAAPSASQVNGAGQANPRQGTPTGAPQPSYTQPTPTANGIAGGSIQIPQNRGAVMDDGGSVAPSVQDLGQLGAQSAKVFQPSGATGDNTSNLVMQGQGPMEQMGDITKGNVAQATPPRRGSSGSYDTPERRASDINVKKLKVESKQLDAEIDGQIAEAEKNQFMNTDGLKKAEALMNSHEGLKKMENLVGKVPNDSQMKAMASKVYLEGIRLGKTGKALGAGIGLAGGVAGVIAGNVVGDTLGEVVDGQDMGKGSQKLVKDILTSTEIKAIDEYHRVSSLLVPQMVKTSDGNMVTNPEAKEMSNNFFNYGQTADQQQASINTLKADLLTKSSTQSRLSGAGKDQFNYRQQMPIDYRARAAVGKASQESMNRETGRQAIQQQYKAAEELQGQGGWFGE